jgi:DNA-binding MarR family transcriptional regulator
MIEDVIVFKSLFKVEELTHTEVFVLSIVIDEDYKNVSDEEIGKVTRVKSSTARRLLSGLMKKGFITISYAYKEGQKIRIITETEKTTKIIKNDRRNYKEWLKMEI